MSTNDTNDFVEGTVLEALPNAMFKVELSDGNRALVYLSGKMRIHHIKVLVGDKVSLKMDSYGERGRIVKRL
jgi:translation initiation factor IF-1